MTVLLLTIVAEVAAVAAIWAADRPAPRQPRHAAGRWNR